MSNYKISIEESKDSKNIIKVEKSGRMVYLGSKYSVDRDISNLKKFINEHKDSNAIIIGLSTGEYIDEIKDITKDKKVIIIEPCKEIYELYLIKERKEENIIILPLLKEYIDLINLYIKKNSVRRI